MNLLQAQTYRIDAAFGTIKNVLNFRNSILWTSISLKLLHRMTSRLLSKGKIYLIIQMMSKLYVIILKISMFGTTSICRLLSKKNLSVWFYYDTVTFSYDNLLQNLHEVYIFSTTIHLILLEFLALKRNNKVSGFTLLPPTCPSYLAVKIDYIFLCIKS